MHISFEESKVNKSLNNLQLAKIYAGVFGIKDGKIVLEDLAWASDVQEEQVKNMEENLWAKHLLHLIMRLNIY